MTNTYMILEELRGEVDKKLKRLQKKADKYGVPFSVTSSEPYGYEVTHKIDGRNVKRIYEVYDLTIDGETIKNGDYTVLSRIEHTISGNIVNVFVGEMDAEWAKIPAHCDHCNGNHGQKFTFIVDNGTERKQVGRTCLKDYCGIDPQTVGMFNEFFDSIECYTPDCYDFDKPIPYGYESTMVLALAMEAYAEQGYRKSDERGSNKEYILHKINLGEKASVEFWEPAQKLADAIKALSIDEAIEAGLSNVQTRINGWYCKASDFGYFAYAPVAYEKHMVRIERQKRREQENAALGEQSEYIGNIGERIAINVKEVKLLTSWYGNYGTTYLYRFIDDNDNVLIWLAANTIEDKTRKIKATVKDHSERDGIKQTIITRVKAA